MNGRLSYDFREILARHEKEVELSSFMSEKDFSDLFYTGNGGFGLDSVRNITFYQATYYVRFSEYSTNKVLVVVKQGMEKDLEKYVEEVNKKVTELYEEFIESSVPQYDRDTFRYFHRVGTDFGICHFSLLKRNGLEELTKDMEEDYSPDDNECSTCRGGGCPRCEPYRFI